MTVRAYAKINLGLRILRKRPDGYHDIETVFHQIDNHDSIELIETGNEITVEANSDFVPVDATNLCVKAAQLLSNISHVSRGVRIVLRKNIPVAAGLGGGSSDAAATLKGLVKLWDLALRQHELERIALNLGSDVSFFLEGGTAFASGRGELLEQVKIKLPYWILVVTPPLQISTAWAYAQVVPSERHDRGLRATLEQFPEHPQDVLINDFEAVVSRAHPQVKELKELLMAQGAEFSAMSGTGPSVFAFFQDEDAASIAALKLSSTYYTSLTSPSFKPDLALRVQQRKVP